MKLFFKCNETAEACDKCQYKEASIWDNFRMKVHFIICKYCRNYSTNNGKLTKSIKSANIKSISQKKKELLKAQIHQEINTDQRSI